MDAEMHEGGVDIITSNEPSVDSRILGTYDGDGSMRSIDKLATPRGLLTPFIVAAEAFIVILAGLLTAQKLLNGVDSSTDWFHRSLILAAIASVVSFLTVCGLGWHYIEARLRYGAMPKEATYWQINRKLRRHGCTPYSKREFCALLQLAEEADHDKTLTYVAEETERYYRQLIGERNLKMYRLDQGFIKRQILAADE